MFLHYVGDIKRGHFSPRKCYEYLRIRMWKRWNIFSMTESAMDLQIEGKFWHWRSFKLFFSLNNFFISLHSVFSFGNITAKYDENTATKFYFFFILKLAPDINVHIFFLEQASNIRLHTQWICNGSKRNFQIYVYVHFLEKHAITFTVSNIFSNTNSNPSQYFLFQTLLNAVRKSARVTRKSSPNFLTSSISSKTERYQSFTHLHHQGNRDESLTLVLRLAHVVIQFRVESVHLYLKHE